MVRIVGMVRKLKLSRCTGASSNRKQTLKAAHDIFSFKRRNQARSTRGEPAAAAGGPRPPPRPTEADERQVLARLYCRTLQLKPKLETNLTYFSVKRCNRVRFKHVFHGLELQRPTRRAGAAAHRAGRALRRGEGEGGEEGERGHGWREGGREVCREGETEGRVSAWVRGCVRA